VQRNLLHTPPHSKMNDIQTFWQTEEASNPSQLQRYEAKGSPEHIKKFIMLGGGQKMGTTCERFARHRFPSLKKRSKGAGQTGYDHQILVKDKRILVEQKSSGHWCAAGGVDDFKWQHVEKDHPWKMLLLCGIAYTEVLFWAMDRATFTRLIVEGKITNQGNKAGDSSEGMWFSYSAVSAALTPITSDADLQRYAEGLE
jgi:hypothetical protein